MVVAQILDNPPFNPEFHFPFSLCYSKCIREIYFFSLSLCKNAYVREHEDACVHKYLSEGICVSERECVLKRGAYEAKGVERLGKMRVYRYILKTYN